MIFNASSESSGQLPVTPIGGHKMDIFEATQRFGADIKKALATATPGYHTCTLYRST